MAVECQRSERGAEWHQSLPPAPSTPARARCHATGRPRSQRPSLLLREPQMTNSSRPGRVLKASRGHFGIPRSARNGGHRHGERLGRPRAASQSAGPPRRSRRDPAGARDVTELMRRPVSGCDRMLGRRVTAACRVGMATLCQRSCPHKSVITVWRRLDPEGLTNYKSHHSSPHSRAAPMLPRRAMP